MPLITWDETYSVNVGEIDQQHRKLVAMINDFYEGLGRDSAVAMRSLLDALLDYTRYHFATEENYFRQLAFPAAESHLQAHQVFVDKVVDIRRRMERGELVVSFEITNFLREWLIHHVKEMDKAYSDHFSKHGVV